MVLQYEFSELASLKNVLIGIYAITSKYDGKNYVGQTKNFKKRFMQHRLDLKKKDHDNIYLQRSYDKRGENEFIFRILEICDENVDLDKKEQEWIDKLDSMYHSRGWNILYFDECGKRRGTSNHTGRDFEIMLPSGEIYKGNNVLRFCKDHGLNGANITHLLQGNHLSYKGYRSLHPNAQRIPKPDLNLISPDGKFVTIKAEHKSAFIIDIGAGNLKGPFGHMIQGKVNSCKGWRSAEHYKKFEIKKPRKRVNYPLIDFGCVDILSPEGKVYRFIDYRKFAQKYNLDSKRLIEVIRGTLREGKPATMHRGWKLYKGPAREMIFED